MSSAADKLMQEYMKAEAGCDSNKPMAGKHEERRYTEPVQGKQCQTTRRDRRRAAACRGSGLQWWRIQCFLSYAISELVGAFFIGIFAVASSDYAAAYGGGALNAFQYGFTYLVVIFALGLTFGQFGAGHYNPAVTLMAWLCDPDPFGMASLVRYPSMWVGQFLGFLLSAFLAAAYVGGSAPLGCTNVTNNALLGSTAGARQALAFVMEFLGLLLILHTVVLAGMRRKGGPLTNLAVGAEFGALIAVFGSSTGGSFNLFRTLGVGIVEGCLGADIWVYIVAFVLAPVVTGLLVTYVFAPHCGGQLPNLVVAEVCPEPEKQSKQC